MAFKSFILDGKKRFAQPFNHKSIADYPTLKKEFNKKKNNIDPKYISSRSNIKFYWKCKKGHEWQVAPTTRFLYSPEYKTKYKNRGKRSQIHSKCPYCMNKFTDKSNCLETLYPKISKMWSKIKNEETPDQVNALSQKKFWWICKKGHEFEKEVYQVVKQNGFCGGCGKEDGTFKTFVTKENSLAAIAPDIAKQWHPTKNGKIKPENLIAHGHKKYWWKCEKGPDHEFKQSINDKVKENIGCPFCSYRKVGKTNNLEHMYPNIAKQWHPTKNGKTKPEDVPGHSQKNVWWKCNRNHEWQALINSRTRNGHGCRKCTGIGISYMEIRVYSELLTIFKNVKWSFKFKGYQCDIFIPEINTAIEVDGKIWHSEDKKIIFDKKKSKFLKENKIKIIRIREDDLFLIDEKLDINAYFIKPKLSFMLNLLDKIKLLTSSSEVLKQIDKYKKNKNFINDKVFNQICSNLPAPIYENSLEYNHKEISKEWDYEKNLPLVPSMFKSGSQISVWWICKKKHSYKAVISNRTTLKRGCPYCAGRYALPDFNLALKYPELSKQWHPSLNVLFKPKDFTPVSGQYVWWKCKNDHAFRKTIARRVKQNANCPCFLVNDKHTKYKASSFPLLRKEFLEKKNKTSLKKLSIDDKKLYWWKCKNNHIYKNSIFNRTFYMERCPEIKCKKDAMDFHKSLHERIIVKN